MTLRDQLIRQIEQLPPADLIALQNVILAISKISRSQAVATGQAGHLQTRKALSVCPGNLSDDIITEREDRI